VGSFPRLPGQRVEIIGEPHRLDGVEPPKRHQLLPVPAFALSVSFACRSRS
jgi:hypothetical protein